MHINVNSFIINKVNKVHTSENAKMRYSDHTADPIEAHSFVFHYHSLKLTSRFYSTLFTLNIGIKWSKVHTYTQCTGVHSNKTK